MVMDLANCGPVLSRVSLLPHDMRDKPVRTEYLVQHAAGAVRLAVIEVKPH